MAMINSNSVADTKDKKRLEHAINKLVLINDDGLEYIFLT